MTPHRLTLAHSPDPDDVFMWSPLGSREEPPAFDTWPFRFERIEEDIQALNRRAVERGDLDITAISIHVYPLVRERYRLTDCGGSFGEGYGPKIVVREASDAPRAWPAALDWLRRRGRVFAVPGLHTTAWLVLNLMLGEGVQGMEARFDTIPSLVADGSTDAGLLIHDAQLTFGRLGLREVADLGAWWQGETGLPLPLGGNVIRRDLDERFGAGSSRRVALILERSIGHALSHRGDWIERLRARYPSLEAAALGRYLSMYVSPLTVSAGDRGRAAIEELLGWGARAGRCPPAGRIDLLRGADGPESGGSAAASERRAREL